MTCPPGTALVAAGGGGNEVDYRPGYDYCNVIRTLADRTTRRRSIGCYAGSYPRRPVCTKCLFTNFSNQTNSRICQTCPRGTRASELGSTECGGCEEPGVSCFQGKRVRECRARQVNDGSMITCMQCPPGFVGNTAIRATMCVQCPEGTFKPFFRGNCRRCTRGRVVTDDRRACVDVFANTPCPDNFFKNKKGICDQCEIWERLDKKSGMCVMCPENTISRGVLDKKCRKCPAGSGRLADEKGECTCMEGFVSVLGKCEQCPLGSEASESGCTPCRAGTFRADGMLSCENCPLGQVAPYRGSSTCESCPEGTIADVTRGCVSPETNCLPGDLRVVDENNVLVGCDAQSCPEGLGIFQRRLCTGCTFFDPRSIGFCDLVPPRARVDPDTGKAVGCPTGQFQMKNDVTKCELRVCPDNAFVAEDGECVCSNPRVLVDGECVECPEGTEPSFALQKCIKCPVGTFSAGRAFARRCTPCAINTFNDMKGSSSCKDCPPGTFAPWMGSANCVVQGSS